MSSAVTTAHVDVGDARAAVNAAACLAARFATNDHPRLLVDLVAASQELPQRIRGVVNRFRLEEAAGCLRLRGFPFEDDALGPTPDDWRTSDPARILTLDVLLLLVVALLGEPFAWRTQQNGRLVHDILPIRRDEHAQLGSSSRALLTWHNEDAFHEARADYVGFLALRNPDRVATTVGALKVSALPEEIVDILFEPRFYILPDYSHFALNNTVDDSGAFARIQSLADSPPPIAALAGSRDDPYLRLDPFFMRCADGDVDAHRALEAVAKVIDASMEDLVLEPGDVCILDNLSVVHGRKPFVARYDGTDRWLKRVNVARDIRRSRSHRPSATSRVVG